MLKSLWIMRHGLAANEFESDFNRALSPTGQKQAEDVAGQILQSGEQIPEVMLVSPFRRTQETAQIVHQKLGLARPFETEDLLVHFGDHQLLGDFLTNLAESRVMIVSHMPIVARLCQYLSPSCEIYGFNTAQTVRLDFDEQLRARVGKIFNPK